MKKVFALLLAGVMAVGLTSVALATSRPPDGDSDAGIRFTRASYPPGIFPYGPYLDALHLFFGRRDVSYLATVGTNTLRTTDTALAGPEGSLMEPIDLYRRRVELRVQHNAPWSLQVNRSHFVAWDLHENGTERTGGGVQQVLNGTSLYLIKGKVEGLSAIGTDAPRLVPNDNFDDFRALVSIPSDDSYRKITVASGGQGQSKVSFAAELAGVQRSVAHALAAENQEFATVITWSLVSGTPGGSQPPGGGDDNGGGDGDGDGDDYDPGLPEPPPTPPVG